MRAATPGETVIAQAHCYKATKHVAFLRAVAHDGDETDPIALFIGEEFTLVMPYIESNIGNPTLPALHGGSISGLMEMAAILRKGNPKDTYARAMIFKQGSRVANVRVRAWQDDYDKPIAAMHGHYLTAKAQ